MARARTLRWLPAEAVHTATRPSRFGARPWSTLTVASKE